MPTGRGALGVGVVNGVLYAVGGGYAGVLATNEAFTPAPILSVNMYAGLTIWGPIGNTCEIDYCNDLAASNWTTLTTMVLSNSPCLYFDTNSTWFSHRFYRVMSQ